MNTPFTDVVIIGAGPVGLFAIFECGMMRMNCHVVDTLEMIGGQCAALYPEKPIYDIPGHPQISGQELIHNLAQQASPFQPTYHLGVQVTEMIQAEENRWIVGLSNGKKINSKVVIIAAGVGAFGPHRPPLSHIESYEGKSIFYYIKSRETFREKHVVIAGGGDSAVDWALSLSDIASKVMVVHRRSKFRAAPESEARLHALGKEGRIELIIPYQLERLEGENGFLKTVVVKSLEGDEKHLSTDYLLPFFGLSMNLGPISHWGLNLDHHHINVNPSSSATNLEGVYAIGDIATYPSKMKLILTGFAEAAQAAQAAREKVFPGENWHFEYSTTQGLPQAS